MPTRRDSIAAFLGLFAGAAPAAGTKEPVRVGLTAEFGFPGSTSDDAVRAGIQIAIAEINAAGGVLGGRPFELVERDDRAVPQRGVDNLREMASLPDLVASFVSKHSPVALEALPTVHEQRLPLLDPWAAADGVIDNGYKPNYAFRLSLRDTWAIEALLGAARDERWHRVGVLVPNTAWGRSSLLAAERFVARQASLKLVGTAWYNWGDSSLLNPYRHLLQARAQVLLLVANEREGTILLHDLAKLPAEQRLPILSHWGVTGGDFFDMNRGVLPGVDLRVVQTFSFVGATRPQARALGESARRLLGVARVEDLPSPVGLAHAYDLMHLLARAVDLARSTDRAAVRDALERLPAHEGAVRRYAQPFTADRHEALDASQIFLASYGRDGVLRRTPPRRGP